MNKQKYISIYEDDSGTLEIIGKGKTKRESYLDAQKNFSKYVGGQLQKGKMITYSCSDEAFDSSYKWKNIEAKQIIDDTFYSSEELDEFEEKEQQKLYDELVRLTDDGMLWENAKNIFSSFSTNQQNLFILEQILEIKHKLNNL